MKRVFLDTVGLLALWDASDQWHEAASSAVKTISANQVRTITSELILLECGNAAARKPYRHEVVALRMGLIESNALITVSADDIELAWNAYEGREAAGAGIVDQVSFLLMRRLGITEALTNDEHFRAAGFVTLF